MKKNYCQNCGLMYRDWIHKAELTVCDECEPEKFATLHKQNIRRIKRRTIGQEHITENTFFPAVPTTKKYNKRAMNRREVK
jgi:ribosome-binding protein aMBF1 (putative translation factor)